MGTWYKITLPTTESGVTGGQELENVFGRTLTMTGGKPLTAALFSQMFLGNVSVNYYFSPDAVSIAKDLVQTSGAVPCDQPEPPSTDVYGVRLAVGDARAPELLWPKT